MNPIIPLDQTGAMINLDMISRNENNEVTLVGSNRSPEMHKLNIAANNEQKPTFTKFKITE